MSGIGQAQRFDEKLCELIEFVLRKDARAVERLKRELAELSSLNNSELDKAKALNAKLRSALEGAMADYQASLATFEKFRQAIAIVRRIRDHCGIVKAMHELKNLFKLKDIHLVLEEKRFAGLVPEEIGLCQAQVMERFALSCPGLAKGNGYLGKLSEAAGYESVFGKLRQRGGSCFIEVLRDKFDSGVIIGTICLLDSDPNRYVKDKASDFLEHFCESLADVIVEITDRHLAERLREDVERITRHDLKTPLSTVLTIPQLLLKDENLTQQQRELLLMLKESGYRMLGMIDLTLSLYRMETGVYELKPEAVDLFEIVETVKSELHGLLMAKELKLEVSSESGQASFKVRGEKLLCYTMLSNILKNAFEASPDKEIVRVIFSESKGREVIVHNLGAVPEAVRERFFEKYATYGKRYGSGLGTYSAWLIAKTLGAAISMRTSEAKGTMIRLRFKN